MPWSKLWLSPPGESPKKIRQLVGGKFDQALKDNNRRKKNCKNTRFSAVGPITVIAAASEPLATPAKPLD